MAAIFQSHGSEWSSPPLAIPDKRQVEALLHRLHVSDLEASDVFDTMPAHDLQHRTFNRQWWNIDIFSFSGLLSRYIRDQIIAERRGKVGEMHANAAIKSFCQNVLL